jgi:hypothetical protein
MDEESQSKEERTKKADFPDTPQAYLIELLRSDSQKKSVPAYKTPAFSIPIMAKSNTQ